MGIKSGSWGSLTDMNLKKLSLFFGVLATTMSSTLLTSSISASDPPKVLDLVILVDESSSLSASDVQAEIQAVASLVARRELSGKKLTTRVAIAGFGSGSSAVDEKCPPTVVTTDNVNDFVLCAEQVKRRSIAGQHTDFAKAFDYASSVFKDLKSESLTQAVILLTDGKYDPTGKRGSSGLAPEDIEVLNNATAALREQGVQIWPLGFGQVLKDELDELARKGASSQCDKGTQPYAIIAAPLALDEQLLTIIGALICAGVGGPKSTPYDFEVHPFVNEVTLTIRGASDDPDVVVVATDKKLCVGEWKLAEDGSLACVVKVTGPDSGTWKITTPQDASSQQKPTVETSLSGRVDLRLSECENSNVVVSVSRIDDTEIRWNATGFTFPRAVLVDQANRQEIGSLVLTSDSLPVSLSNSGTTLKDIEVSLASSQADFVWLTASVDTCEVTPPSTTPTTPTVQIPNAPTSIRATPAEKSVSVSFTAGAQGGGVISNYQYALSTNGGSSYGAFVALNPADDASPITVTGLSKGTAYYLKLKAVNSYGTSGESSAVSFRTTNPLPWLWIFLFLVVAAGLVWYLRRRSEQGKFPVGAELRQRNVAQNPAANWNTRADLGGQRAVSFSFDRNGWLVEANKEDAVLSIQRVRSKTEGDFVVIQPARASDGGEAQEGTKAYHSFSVQGESGSGIGVKNTYIRVEVPEDVEEEEDEEE